jgi:NAD(P)-dependent dehydrogenase (short-subunit alcohol dehydrogenase family)
MDFAGRVAIVTGGGRGLGRAYALDLAARGTAVAVVDLPAPSDNPADEVIAEITAGGGVGLALNQSIVGTEEAAQIVRAVTGRFGRIDILINNAGMTSHVPLVDLTEAEVERIFAVHLSAAINLSRECFGHMANQKYGRIVFTSSGAGLFGRVGGAAYGTAKAGLLGLMNAVSIEGAEHGILANAVLPVALTTISSNSSVSSTLTSPTDGIEDRIAPESVAPIVVYLASDACSVSRHLYSAVAGRYARVFVSVGHGWLYEGPDQASADVIAEHWDEIDSTSNSWVPDGLIEELSEAAGRAREVKR